MFRSLCGDSTLKGVVLVTNMWGEVSQEDGEEREEQLTSKYFKLALDKGASIARHLNTVESAHDIIRGIMRKRLQVPLQIQRELVDDKKSILETAAGEVLNAELNEEIRHHQAEIAGMQEEMKQALEEKDEETKKELEQAIKEHQDQVNKTRTDLETMTSQYETLMIRIEDEVTKCGPRALKTAGALGIAVAAIAFPPVAAAAAMIVSFGLLLS